jgi:hypothetical protein
MSPLTSRAKNAYGTLCTGERGNNSGSAPMVIPKYRNDPSNTLSPNGSIDPSETE